jgi:hypothetical protein
VPNISKLIRWSGLACILGGVLFPISIAIHPLRDGPGVNNSPYSAIHVLIAVALMLVLFGLLGLYLRQAEKIGLTGFILAFIGTVLTYGLIVIEGFSWPTVGFYNPEAVHNFDPSLAAPRGSSLVFIFVLGVAIFAVGYIMFGIATMRARVLPRLGGLLIAIGAPIYFLGAPAIPVLGPESVIVTVIETIGATAFGAGFAWLGYSLWSSTE